MKFSKLWQKEKYFYLLAVLLLLLFFWASHDYFNFQQVRNTEFSWYYTIGTFLRESVSEGFFPHWIPYYYGGSPFFANAQNMFFRLFSLLAAFTPSFAANTKIQMMLIMTIGMVSLYFFMLEIKIKPRYAMLSALFYLFNPFPMTRIIRSGDEFMNMYFWIPLIFLLTLKAMKAKNIRKIILFSILSGLIAAVQFHSGSIGVFIFTIFLLFLFVVSFFKISTIKKIVIFGVVFSVIFLGLAAVKIFPLLEFAEISSVNQARGIEAAKGQHLDSSTYGKFGWFDYLVVREKVYHGGDQIAIGILGLILVLGSLLKWRNRYVLFCSITLIIFFFTASGSSLFVLLYKIFPGFSRQHHIIRILQVAPFQLSILLGIGAQNYFEAIYKKFKFVKYKRVIAILMLLLLAWQIGFFSVRTNYPWLYTKSINEEQVVEDNKLMAYLGEEREKEIFRIHNLKNVQIGTNAVLYATKYKLELVHGAFNVWIPQYVNEYLWAAMPSDPMKYLGMLNTKYIYSDEELDDEELEFVQEFPICQLCREEYKGTIDDGPYLYFNKEFVPRAYTVDNAILVLGDSSQARSAMYFIMSNPNFRPRDMVVIMENSLEFLDRYKAVILVSSPSQEDISILQSYKENGGVVVPDIFSGQTQLSQDEIDKLLIVEDDKADELEIQDYSPNGYTVEVDDGNFLVLSEKFFMFEGWKARSNDNLKSIRRANGINSAVFLDGEDKIEFYYDSETFKKGALLSVITLIVILLYLGYYASSYIMRGRRNQVKGKDRVYT